MFFFTKSDQLQLIYTCNHIILFSRIDARNSEVVKQICWDTDRELLPVYILSRSWRDKADLSLYVRREILMCKVSVSVNYPVTRCGPFSMPDLETSLKAKIR